MSRSREDLAFVVAKTIEQSKGSCVFNILAYDAAEVEVLKALLKGKHGAGAIGIKLQVAP